MHATQARAICRLCGAKLTDTSTQCWYCHRPLKAADIIVDNSHSIAFSSHIPPEAMTSKTVAYQHLGDRADELLKRLSDAVHPPAPAQPATAAPSIDWEEIYVAGLFWVGMITFVACWIYAIAKYGWFLGIGLGWFPSLVIARIAAWLWPLTIIGGVILLIFFAAH